MFLSIVNFLLETKRKSCCRSIQSSRKGEKEPNGGRGEGVKDGVKSRGRGTRQRAKNKNHPEIPSETFLKERALILTSSRLTPRKLSSLKAVWHRIPNN